MRVWSSLALLTCLGCATVSPPPPIVEPPAPPTVADVPAPASPPREEVSRLMASERPARIEPSMTAITWANAQARVQPTREAFDRAIVRFRHAPGHLYHIDTGVDAPTDLVFPAGEEVLHFAGLDDKRFKLLMPKSHEEGTDTHLLLLATEANARGRITITTTRSAYYLEVQSHEKPGLVAVSWQLPTPPKLPSTFLTPGVYRVGYAIKVEAGVPVWTPLGVWDTGDRGKTLILFPKARLTHQAPVFFIIGPDGQKHLTNGRARGQWFEVDRLFGQAELRVGHDRGAEVVTLTRTQDYRALWCPGSPECPPTDTLMENPRTWVESATR